MQPTTIFDNTHSNVGFFQLNNVLFQKSALQFEVDAVANSVKIYRFADGSILFNNLPFANMGYTAKPNPLAFANIAALLAYINTNCK